MFDCCEWSHSGPCFDVVCLLDKELPGGFPQIIQNPGMKVVEKGRNAVLVCEAGGDPNPTVTWIKVTSHSLIHFKTLLFQDTMPVIIDSGDNPRISLMQQGKLRGEANGDFIRETSVLENSLL